MGMFDTICVPCAYCGAPIEEQTKSGLCHLRYCTLDDMPADIAVGIQGMEVDCPACLKTSVIQSKVKVELCVVKKEDQ